MKPFETLASLIDPTLARQRCVFRSLIILCLGACAQPPIALPPPLPEDCGLWPRDREDLERWEREMFEPIREIDAHGSTMEEVDEPFRASSARCNVHDQPLQVLPSIAVPGLAGSTSGGSVTVISLGSNQTEIAANLRENFNVMTWATFFGPPNVENARLHVQVGCYYRTPFVPVHACAFCRAEYRRWCREYPALREQHLREYPARYAEWCREWSRGLAELFPAAQAPASGQD